MPFEKSLVFYDKMPFWVIYPKERFYMNETETKIVQTCISALMLILNRSETEAYKTATESEQAALTVLMNAAKETYRKAKNELEEARTYFTKKEITEMPNLRDCHIRQKPSGVWEIRYRKEGANMSFSSRSLNEAKNKAREYFRELNEELKKENALFRAKAKKPTFADFAQTWLDVEKKPYIKEITYYNYRDDLEKRIFPRFGDVAIDEVTYVDLQDFVNGFVRDGKNRTAKKMRNLLQQIFESAAEQDIVERSPAARLKDIIYEAKSGKAFSLEEERAFVTRTLESSLPCKYAILLFLYTGIRRDEFKRIKFDEDRKWITVQNGKTKKGRTSERRVPVSPMLAPYVWNITDEDLKRKNDYYSRAISALTDGKHHLHELRHTFVSRCQEMGIPPEVVSRWVGHTRQNNTTDKVYTHFSDDFMLEMVKKLDY